jgi:hypothetical protein
LPWSAGGNRAGFLDTHNHFEGRILVKVGVSTEHAVLGGLTWSLRERGGDVLFRGAAPSIQVDSLDSLQVAEISLELMAGEYVLEAEFADASNRWPLWVVERDATAASSFAQVLTLKSLPKRPPGTILQFAGEGTIERPFWREAAYEFLDPEFWDCVPFENEWSRLLAVSGDRVLDMQEIAETLDTPGVPLLRRIDTRTYREEAVIARFGGSIATTLRPMGGLGMQPNSLETNPAGVALLRGIRGYLKKNR